MRYKISGRNLNYVSKIIAGMVLMAFFSFTKIDKTIYYSTNSQKGALADTSIVANTAQGWGLYASYLNNIGDSVDFEIVFTRVNNIEVVWSDFSEAATISNSFRPLTEQRVTYYEPTRTWLVQIMPDGRCLLQQLGGPKPTGNPCLIPVHFKYRR